MSWFDYINPFAGIRADLRRVLIAQEKIMATLDQLLIDVRENSDAVDSAVVLLKGLKEKLDAAGTDPVKLKELSAAIDAQTAKLAAAVVESTPDEPSTT